MKHDLTAIIESTIFVIIFTYFGVLARLSLSLLSEALWDTLLPQLGASFFLPNILGSFIMGFAVSLIDYFRSRPYWHVGITSGFCGSCTTFATWQRTSAELILNGQVVDSLLISVSTFCTSYIALLSGRHLGDHLAITLRSKRRGARTYTEQQQQRNPESITDEKHASRLKIDVSVVACVSVLVSGGLWSAAFLDPSMVRRGWWIAMALGPLGSVIRYLSSLYNKNFPKFPVATFLMNILASVIAMSFSVVQRYMDDPDSNGPDEYFQLWAMYGLGVGLMGSMSTVSTFVNELNKMNTVFYAYRYGFSSVIIAQGLCILVGCAVFFHPAGTKSSGSGAITVDGTYLNLTTTTS